MLRRTPEGALSHPVAGLLAMALAATLVAGCRPNAAERTADRTVLGVGGSFPAPLYTRWSTTYRAVSGVTVNYQGVGSPGGVQQKLAKLADFAASDEPMTLARLDADGLYQFPVVVGGVVPIVNLPGVGLGQLRLTGPLLADIYLGAIKRWDDPRIAALNSGVKLPPEAVVVAHRAIGSGTTFLFTSYLSRISPAWKAKVGAGDLVVWPTGVASRGNGGLIDFVQQTSGAIGYVEFAYARQAGVPWVQLQNHDGAFVSPGAASFGAAVSVGAWGAGSGANDVDLLDEPGAGSWPITGATYIVLFKRSPKPPKTRQVLAFFDWAYQHGDVDAVRLDYAPLPAAVKERVRNQWATTIRDATGQSLYAPAS